MMQEPEFTILEKHIKSDKFWIVETLRILLQYSSVFSETGAVWNRSLSIHSVSILPQDTNIIINSLTRENMYTTHARCSSSSVQLRGTLYIVSNVVHS